MAYPLQSDFTSPDRESAWWGYSTQFCATTGAAFLRGLRSSLGLADTAVWDADLQSALITQARALRAAQGSSWDALINALTTDASAHSVSRTSITFALYLAYYRPSGLRLDAINVPGAVLPVWGAVVSERSPDGFQDKIVCFDPQTDDNPFFLNEADTASVQAQSASGVRLHPGESLPNGPSFLPNISGVSGLMLGLISVGITGIVFAVIHDRPRKAPRRLYRSTRR